VVSRKIDSLLAFPCLTGTNAVRGANASCNNGCDKRYSFDSYCVHCVRRKGLKCSDDECVSSQDRNAFAKLSVYRGFSSSLSRVVKAGKVVVY
jgi:hypothetical protein